MQLCVSYLRKTRGKGEKREKGAKAGKASFVEPLMNLNRKGAKDAKVFCFMYRPCKKNSGIGTEPCPDGRIKELEIRPYSCPGVLMNGRLKRLNYEEQVTLCLRSIVLHNNIYVLGRWFLTRFKYSTILSVNSSKSDNRVLKMPKTVWSSTRS